MTKRIAVIGAGNLARLRTKALLSTNKVAICGVASRTLASAQKFGKEIGCEPCFSDFRQLADTAPDAVLVEVPHGVQDEIVLWILNQGWHVLIGGCLAASCATAEKIRQIAARRRLVVEAGYQDRYSAAWEKVKQLVAEGHLGRSVGVRSIALWDGDPASWYYRQQASGGMPLTHMTYCFINLARWILGEPLCVSAFANRIKHTGPGLLDEESCVANFRFGQNVIGSMTASFIKPGAVPGWSVLFLGTEGAAEICPLENSLTIYRAGHTEKLDFSSARDAFEVQAEVFVAALEGRNECRNAPDATAADIRVAEAIVTSARQNATVWIGEKTTAGQPAAAAGQPP